MRKSKRANQSAPTIELPLENLYAFMRLTDSDIGCAIIWTFDHVDGPVSSDHIAADLQRSPAATIRAYQKADIETWLLAMETLGIVKADQGKWEIEELPLARHLVQVRDRHLWRRDPHE